MTIIFTLATIPHLVLGEHLSADFALETLLVVAPAAVRRDVIEVTQLAAEDFVALPAVVGLGATLQVELGVVALEGCLALEVDAADLAVEGVVAGAVLLGHVTLVRDSVLQKSNLCETEQKPHLSVKA